MKVELIHNTPLWICSKAIRKCWASEDKSDTFLDGKIPTTGKKDKELIHRVGNKNKHSSTLEHLNYSFDIDGISRACLQELARHRHTSMSVKSTRYTLKELRDSDAMFGLADDTGEKIEDIAGFNFLHINKIAMSKFVVFTGIKIVDDSIMIQLHNLQSNLKKGVSNDIAKYSLPESYKTSLVWTINLRSLQNFLALRLSKSALWEIQDLSCKIVQALPKEHLYLVEDIIKDSINGNERIKELIKVFD